MIGFNRTMPGMGVNPMPGYQYVNPYCNVNTVPVGNTLPYSQRLGNNQQFVNQLVNPNMSYEDWKRNSGLNIHTNEEEDYYLNLYNTQVLPQQRVCMINQQRTNFYNQISGQTQYPYQINSPYAYQNPYIYGYDATKDTYEYNAVMCGLMPRLYEAAAVSQTEIMKKRETEVKNQVYLLKKFTSIAMRHCNRSEEDITKRLKEIDEDSKPTIINPRTYKPTTNNKPTNPKVKKIKRRLVCGTKVIQEFGEFEIGPNEYRPKTREEIQAAQNERAMFNNAHEVVYVATMNPKVREMFQNNINKFSNMSLVEFLNNHGGILVGEAMESQFINAYRHKVYDYNKSNYINTIGNHSQYRSYTGTIGSQPKYAPRASGVDVNKTRSFIVGSDISFVDFLNVMDVGEPVSRQDYQQYLSLAKDEETAKALAVYKAFHQDFDVNAYMQQCQNADADTRINEAKRIYDFYTAMINRRPELRNRT